MFAAIKQLFAMRQEEMSFRPPVLGDSGPFRIEIQRYSNGLLSEFRDARGRSWHFTYAGGKVVRFTDPTGTTWCEENSRWHGFVGDGKVTGARAPVAVHIDQESGEISLRESERELVYRPDGNTCIRWHEDRENGLRVDITVTEYATMPGRTRVTVERHSNGKEFLRVIEDANGRCYKFEYSKDAMLSTMTDWSGRKPILWRAERDGMGKLIRWISGEADAQAEMVPHLESVDLQGNRFYKTADGRDFVVRPNGSAFMGTAR